MIKRSDIIGRVKTFLAGNLTFALIALPVSLPINITASNTPAPVTTEPQTTILASASDMLIPQQKLDLAFNIADNTNTAPTFQIPVDFWYISQYFTSFHPGIDLPN